MLRKWLLITIICLTMVGATGCQSKASKSSQDAGSTMIKTNHYTKNDLQKRYTRISDIVMKTMTKVSLQSDSKEISKTAKKGLGQLDDIRLELANNKTEDGLTKALTNYNKLGSELLTSAINNDAKTYQANGQGFFKQAVSVGEKYFGDQIPQSIRNFANNQQAVTTESSK